jgi:DNA repair protein RecO (recombination protein O)
MIQQSHAIVLHLTPYNDEAFIVDVLTEAQGLVSFLVRRSRSPRAAVRHALFRPLALLSLEWRHRESGGLQRPLSAEVWRPYSSLPYDAHKSAMAFFLAEFLRYAARAEASTEALFGYVVRSVEWLDMCPGGFANFHLVFLLRLARFLGLAPNMEQAAAGGYFDLQDGRFVTQRPLHPHFLAPADAARLPLLMRMNYGTMHVFRFSGQERSRLLEAITTYYRLHLPTFPELKSLAVLKELFDADRR